MASSWMQCAHCGHQFEYRRGVFRCPSCGTHRAAKIEEAARCECFECKARRKKWREERGKARGWGCR